MKSLEGLRVLVTRPAHQADLLCRHIEAQGGVAVKLPLLAIHPTAHAGRAQAQLAAARDDHGWIFTSANAVRHAQPLCPSPWPPQLFAIGAATAAALEAGGHEVQAAPLTAHSSAGLLALPEFAAVAGKKFLIVTGEDGLGVLAPALTERGASASVVTVYRRVPLPYDADTVLSALRGTDVLVVTSGQALAHLCALTPDASRATLFKKQLVLPSARVLEQAQTLGFSGELRIAEPMSDAAILAALV